MEYRTTTNDVVLTSWKDIANYLGKSVRTVQRWEDMYGLPVRRPTARGAKSSVIAQVADLKAWQESDWSERNHRHGGDAMPMTAANQSVDDLIRTSAELRSYHRDLMLDATKAWNTLVARCTQLQSTRIAAAAARQRVKNDGNFWWDAFAGTQPVEPPSAVRKPAASGSADADCSSVANGP